MVWQSFWISFFGALRPVLGLLEGLILRSRGGSDLLLCFVSAWCANTKVFFNVVVMLFKLRKCILTVKTQVFCKIFILVFLSLLLIILARKYLKNTSKWMSKTPQNRSETLLVLSWLSRALSWSILKGFWKRSGIDLEVWGCVTNQVRCHKKRL